MVRRVDQIDLDCNIEPCTCEAPRRQVIVYSHVNKGSEGGSRGVCLECMVPDTFKNLFAGRMDMDPTKNQSKFLVHFHGLSHSTR